ncbi:hypothetical protein FIBSPDRAFT_126840 [Athelia psychrophila]|uniref:Uncharacterized protein n=1 Tax=Athelia psychrophila TaxID=1759441 RepID=A0A166T859_9AGAM|nr:hypothetical protein FIBSPDRAFT_126840 [Fibularhizoctonia sp. CBS 109695]
MSVRYRGFENQTGLNHRGFEAHFERFFRVVRRGSFRGPILLRRLYRRRLAPLAQLSLPYCALRLSPSPSAAAMMLFYD